MNITELSNTFDLYWNNIMSNMAPNLDEYEKSEFLTRAQEELVVKLYASDGFENTELNRRYLSSLLANASIIPVPECQDNSFKDVIVYKMENNSPLYNTALNSDLLVLISEQAEILNSKCCDTKTTVNVVPIKYDELNKVIQNPYKRPNNHKVLRVDKNINEIYIITDTKNALSKYYYEYLKKPTPIVLIDLSQTALSIDGVNTPTGSILHPSLHRTLVQYAAQLAKISWESNNKN